MCTSRVLQYILYGCNLSVGIVLNARFTTNGMRVKNNTHIHAARTSTIRVIAAHELLFAATMQSFAHMPLELAIHNKVVL